jgi:hypothetical protein
MKLNIKARIQMGSSLTLKAGNNDKASIGAVLKRNLGPRYYSYLMEKCEAWGCSGYLGSYVNRVVKSPEDFVKAFGIDEDDDKPETVTDAQALIIWKLEDNPSWGEFITALAYSTEILKSCPDVKEALLKALDKHCRFDT